MTWPNADPLTDASGKLPPVWSYGGYELDTSNFVTAMVHFYRGEMGRANVWRTRLDTTTNWAVVTTGAALTFTFSAVDNPHFVLLLVFALLLTFLVIEARRYSYYVLWYHRVRLLETDFFSAMINPPYQPSPGWAQALSRSLQDPTFPVSRWRAAAIRYRRNYVWIVSVVLISWGLKLGLHPTPAQSLQELVQRAGVTAFIPGSWVVASVITVYIALFGMMLAAEALPILRGDTAYQPKKYREDMPDVEPHEEEHMAIIVTNRKEEVSQELMNDIQRGVTAMSGTGMYTGEPRDVLFCALTASQIAKLRAIVLKIDPHAFVILTGARDVRGRGFAPAPVEPPA
jgi:uncharacterized membrane protein